MAPVNHRIRMGIVIGAALLVALVISGLVAATRADAFVYWTDAAGIGRANVDGSDVDQTFAATTEAPTSVDVDGEHLYWTYFGGEVIRANLDGSGARLFFHTPRDGYMAGSALGAGHIYWAEFYLYGGSIGRADLDLTKVEPQVVSFSHGEPSDVAVDADHLYWVDLEGTTVGRADLDGKHPQPGFIGGASIPTGVAVDDGHVYWSNGGTDTISRARLDGTHVRPGFIHTASDPFGVAVDGGHVFWVNRGAGTIGRAELDGTNVDNSFITGVAGGREIAVDSASNPETTKVKGRATAEGRQRQKDERIRVVLKVRAQEPLTAKARGDVRLGSAKKGRSAFGLRPRTRTIATDGTKMLKLRPRSRRDERRIVRALRDGRKVTAEVSVKLTDQAGNGKTEKLSVRLRP